MFFSGAASFDGFREKPGVLECQRYTELVEVLHRIYFLRIHVCAHSEVEAQEFGNDRVRNLAALPQAEGLL